MAPHLKCSDKIVEVQIIIALVKERVDGLHQCLIKRCRGSLMLKEAFRLCRAKIFHCRRESHWVLKVDIFQPRRKVFSVNIPGLLCVVDRCRCHHAHLVRIELREKEAEATCVVELFKDPFEIFVHKETSCLDLHHHLGVIGDSEDALCPFRLMILKLVNIR